LNPHPGGEILLNPSDREAEIGHKGVGYQVQITESCSAGNDVQLIASAIPQGGSQSDMASFPIIMNKLEEKNALPEKIYSDAGYGSDLEKCEFEDDGRMLKCPAGKKGNGIGNSDTIKKTSVFV